jgi:hypothetical protein
MNPVTPQIKMQLRRCRGVHHAWLYTAFVDFKQAYDSIPRDKLWDNLYYSQMLQHLVFIFHHADEYTMLHGEKGANVQPSFGVKQGCPHSPLPAILNLLE